MFSSSIFIKLRRVAALITVVVMASVFVWVLSGRQLNLGRETGRLQETKRDAREVQKPPMQAREESEFEDRLVPDTGSESTEIIAEVGKWKRHEVSFHNSNWSGNPFDLDFRGVFTHVPSGRRVTQLGFYAGDNLWKIYFMPDEVGEWSFVTESKDPDLDGKTGSFRSIPSDLPGRLIPNNNRWMLEDSQEYIAPVIIPIRQWFKRTNTTNGIDDFIHWADNTVGATLIGTTLTYFNHEQDEMPYIKGQEGQVFNIEMWDRLNSHYDMLRDHGMGAYIMFFSDDHERPDLYNIKPKSKEEERLFRYAIARLAPYPMVLWDTGIDISEYRSNSWIDWFANWFNENDPWRHPVSSRTGGGSGGKFPVDGTYYSDGSSNLPKYRDLVCSWLGRGVPTAYTDRWRENFYRGDFDRDKIRRAVWEVGLVGGTAIYVGGNENDGYLDENYSTDFEAAPDVGYRQDFFRNNILNFGQLLPSNNLLTSGSGIIIAADPGREYVAYVGQGGSIGINLNGAVGSLTAEWFNPRTGETTTMGLIEGGKPYTFNAPDDKDWVLHIKNSGTVLSYSMTLDMPTPGFNFGNQVNLVFIPLALDFNC